MVNLFNIHIKPDEIVSYLKQGLHIKEIYQSILGQKIIESTVQEKNIAISQEDI
jgi:hypothetical protein